MEKLFFKKGFISDLILLGNYQMSPKNYQFSDLKTFLFFLAHVAALPVPKKATTVDQDIEKIESTLQERTQETEEPEEPAPRWEFFNGETPDLNLRRVVEHLS